MPHFHYKAAQADGTLVKGAMEACDEGAVVGCLHEKCLTPIRVAPSETAVETEKARRQPDGRVLFRRASRREVMGFTQELAALLKAGLPVDEALRILADGAARAPFRRLVRDLEAQVQGGAFLSDALARHPAAFSRFYVSLVKAGEAGGALEAVLERLGGFLEAAQDLVDYVQGALIYPAFLAALGGVSIIVLMTAVIPRFAVIFADLGATLPWGARLLMGVSDTLRSHWAWLALLAAAAALTVRHVVRMPAARLRLDGLLLRLPVAGRLVRDIETARFARTLGTLMVNGVPFLQALALVEDVVQNRVLAGALGRVRSRIKEGERLARLLRETELFPGMAVRMIRVGEETGRLDEMLLRVGESFEKSVRQLTKRLVALLEPSMILAMGLVIGFIVISMLLAIFSINDMPF